MSDELDAPTDAPDSALPIAAETDITRTVEDWRGELKTPQLAFIVAKAFHGWPQNRVLTRAQYLQALTDADAGIVIR